MTPAPLTLNPERASIYRIVHRDNLPWILDHGLHCMHSSVADSGYKTIGSEDLIGRRSIKEVPIAPGGVLGDYVPFYFTPFSVMLFNIVTGHGVARRLDEELLVLGSSLHRARHAGIPFVFTDRHAYSQLARWWADIDKLSVIDWTILRGRDFRRDPEDPEKLDRYQAEALVHRHLPTEALLGIICCTRSVGDLVRGEVEARGLPIRVHARERGYFR